MDQSPALTEDATKVIAASWVDLQTLGRIGQANKRYNKAFYEMILCSPESLPGCFLALEDDFDRATPVLQFYAREYEKNGVQKNKAYGLFCRIFSYHAIDRTRGFSALRRVFLNPNDPPELVPFMPACIAWYGSGTAPSFDRTNTKTNSENLHSLFKRKSIYDCFERPMYAVKTFLLGNPSFDILWNGCNDVYPERFPYQACLRCREFLPAHRSIFELLFAGELDEKTIFRAIDLGCENMSWDHVVKLVMRYVKNYSQHCFMRRIFIRQFLQKNYHKSMAVRWEIYRYALSRKGYESEYVIDMLFENDLNARHVIDKTIYFTLLSYAARDKKTIATGYLLEKGANPNEIGCLGDPLLHESYDSAEITAMLIRAGADVDIKRDDGSTALLILPQRYEWNKKKEGVLRVLLHYKADVNKQDNKGKTVLHYFANLKEKYNGVNCDEAFKMIPLLLEHGARITIMDNKGLTALDYACRRNNEYAIKVICDHNNKLKDEEAYRRKKKIISSVCMVVAFIAVGYFMLPTYWF